MSHTPGPWILKEGFDRDSGLRVSRVLRGASIIAECYGPDDIDNARLFAAAPDLLAALQEIVEWTERYTAPGHPITTVAKRAIAKATVGEV